LPKASPSYVKTEEITTRPMSAGTEPAVGNEVKTEVAKVVDLQPDGSLKDHSKYNKVADTVNKAKSLSFKGNAAMVGLDAANFAYEHWDEFDNVLDFATAYGQDIVDSTTKVAEHLYDAAVAGDIPELIVTGVNLTPVPVVTRTIDNVGDILGLDLHTTDTFQDVVSDTVHGVSDAIGGAVDTFKRLFGL